MFGIKKLKRRISELEISRIEWMKIVKTSLEEIKALKDENDKLKYYVEKWRTRTGSLLKEVEMKDLAILELRGEVDKIEKDLFLSEKETQRLTRKRDANGRFVKSVPIKQGFEVGDKVRIKDGISSDTHYFISPGFVSEMDKYIGKTKVIKRLSEKGYVYFSDNIPTHSFHPDWLEHVE